MTVADQLRESHTFAHTSSEEVMAELGHREYDFPVSFCYIPLDYFIKSGRNYYESMDVMYPKF